MNVLYVYELVIYFFFWGEGVWEISWVFFFLFNYVIFYHMPLIFLDAQIPDWFGGESSGSTKDNPFPLPDIYLASQQRNVCCLNHVD